MSMRRLSEAEIDSLLHELPLWSRQDGKLVAEVSFPGFAETMLFVDRVAELAEEANHHPDMDIRYNRVRLALVTHDVDGITERDAYLARRIAACCMATG